MLFEFFVWWYGPGWLDAWKNCFTWVKNVEQAFSVDVLLKTLFSPWKRIISSPGRSIDEKFRGLIDNLISRTVGFMVRLMVLVIALVMIAVMAVAGLVLAILWPVMPLLSLGLIIWGIAG